MKAINPNELRKHVLKMVYDKKSGHIGGSFSLAELISYLYSNYDFDGIDKLILSKGHAVPILYAALCETGVLDEAELSTFRDVDSRLQGHPDKCLLPHMHATTGALGQGLSIAIGHALAKKKLGESGTVFCILGDGELQEGQIWEGFMLAGKLNLDNLVVIVDYNGSQNDGPLVFEADNMLYRAQLHAFGWHCLTCQDGNDTDQVERIIEYAVHSGHSGPSYVVLTTVKGKGVSFMEGSEWHARAPNDEEYQAALEELNG